MDSTDYKILTAISDGKYHSGQDLANLLITSRAAICKRIAKLNIFLEENTLSSFYIGAAVGKGYCLNHKFDAICLATIGRNLGLHSKNIQLVFSSVIDSTNNFLLQNKLDFGKYTVCIAEQQTRGRGRRILNAYDNTTWYSPFGNNIYCSIGWHYMGNQNALIGLSLIAGLSVIETITELGCMNVGLKWPNDILLDNKKIAGILTEIQGEPNGSCKLVIGIGINVHSNYSNKQMQVLNTAISQPWTSVIDNLSERQLCMQSLANISRNTIVAKLLIRFITYYRQFIQHGLSDFLLKLQEYDILRHKLVDIEIAGKKKHGTVVGIDNQGALLIDIDGQIQSFYSGEVKVRAL